MLLYIFNCLWISSLPNYIVKNPVDINSIGPMFNFILAFAGLNSCVHIAIIQSLVAK